jgi:acyl-CoA thioester hydrolase
MTHAPRRRKGGYFPTNPGDPAPLVVRLTERIHFSDVDAMGILWHGRFANLFEKANEALGALCGMTYADFYRDRLRAPVVQLHIDYFSPVPLADEVQIVGRMIWSDGARMDIEYEIHTQDGKLAAAGYTVQMFVDEKGVPLLAPPAMQEQCCRRWLAGELGAAK